MVISEIEGHITGIACENGRVAIVSETYPFFTAEVSEYLFPYNRNVPKKEFDFRTLDRRKIRITVELLEK